MSRIEWGLRPQEHSWAAQPTVMQAKPWKGGVGDTAMLALEKGRTQVSFVLLRTKAWL